MHVGAPAPEDDSDRVAALHALNILDTAEEESFSRITDAAARAFKVPIALVSLVDKNRQWFKAKVGLSVCETPRELAFCAHAIFSSNIFIVRDASKDERFKNSDLVVGPPHIRFYAGAPLEYRDKKSGRVYRLGTLCIIDTIPRDLDEEQSALLATLARLVVTEIQLREQVAEERSVLRAEAQEGAKMEARDLNSQYIGQVAHDLRTPLNSFFLGLQALGNTNLTQEQFDLMATMEVAANLMHLTCAKALDHTHLNHGFDLKAENGSFNIVEMLENSQLVVMGYTHESREVQYEYVLADDVSTHVMSDKEFVWQMYMNLLCNARKFTTAGYIRSEISVMTNTSPAPKNAVLLDFSVAQEDEIPYLRFSVMDTGVGVEDNKVQQLFKPFGQLQLISGGTGLGLYSVMVKAKALCGRCGMYSNEPNGSVFWFEIPYIPGKAPVRKAGSRPRVLRSSLPAQGQTGARIGNISESRTLFSAGATLDDSAHDSPNEEDVEEDDDEDLVWMLRRRGQRRCDMQTKPSSFRRIRETKMGGIVSFNASSMHSIATTASAGHNFSRESIASAQTASAGHNISRESISSAQSVADHSASYKSLSDNNRSQVLGVTSHLVAPNAHSSSAHSIISAAPPPVDEPSHQEVLIIEDDVPTRALMVHGLKRQGYIVHQAGNGEEGLNLMKSRLYHMVLSDIMMPEMDGLECVRRLREWEKLIGGARPQSQYICALSANTSAADVAKAMAAGMNDFFPKPVKMGQLLTFLKDKFMSLSSDASHGAMPIQKSDDKDPAVFQNPVLSQGA
jgi:signal transduction histidine kinase/CheY-like chemotaxis protein